MANEDRGRLESKLLQEANKTAKAILVVLEAEMLGRLRAIADCGAENTDPHSAAVKAEFAFLRKQVLDQINNQKRMISAVLRKFDVEEQDKVVIRLDMPNQER